MLTSLRVNGLFVTREPVNSLTDKFLNIFDFKNKFINIFFRRIYPEADAGGCGDAEFTVKGCGAVLASSDADVFLSEDFCEVVRMDAIERE